MTYLKKKGAWTASMNNQTVPVTIAEEIAALETAVGKAAISTVAVPGMITLNGAILNGVFYGTVQIVGNSPDLASFNHNATISLPPPVAVPSTTATPAPTPAAAKAAAAPAVKATPASASA